MAFISEEVFNRTLEWCLTILTDDMFIALTVVFYVVLFVIFLLQAAFVAFLRRDKFFSTDVRTLLLSGCVWSMISCAGFCVRHSYVLSIYVNKEVLFLNNSVCVLLGSLTFFGLVGEASATFTIAVVLFHSSRRATPNTVSSVLLHCCVLMLSVVCTVVHAGVNHVQLVASTDVICYCTPVSAFYLYTAVPSGALLALYVVSTLLLTYTYLKTRDRILDQTINTAHHGLRERAQLYNLYYTLTNVLPAFSLNGVLLGAIQLAFTFVVKDYYRGSNPTNVKELLGCSTVLVFSRCVLMQLLISRNQYLSNELDSYYPTVYKVLFFYKRCSFKESAVIVPVSIVDCPALVPAGAGAAGARDDEPAFRDCLPVPVPVGQDTRAAAAEPFTNAKPSRGQANEPV